MEPFFLVSFVFKILYIINFCFIIFVFFDKKSPSKTVSWLMVLFFLPSVGFILYLFFGINWRRRKIVNKISESKFLLPCPNDKEKTKEKNYLEIPEANKKRQIINIALNTTKLPISLNNSVKCFNDTTDAFESMLIDVENAKHHIHVEYYIFRDDDTGSRLKDALLKAANQDIEVKLLIDALGAAITFQTGFFKELIEHPNIDLNSFRPVLIPLINLKTNYRNHRKLVVIDGKIGYIGGMNIGNEYLGKDKKFGYWRDTMIRIKGEAVHNIQTIFFQDWYFVKKTKLPRSCDYFPNLKGQNYGENLIHIVPSSPHSNWDSIAQLFFETLASAEESLYIITPYFIPDEALLMALKTAALGGCDVKILLPGKPDKFITFLASGSFIEEVLASGVKVYLYDKSKFVHAKVITADGIIASIGSANMDQRSMNINFEITALIYNKDVVEDINRDFFIDLQNSHQVTMADIQNKGIVRRSTESLARLFSPIL